MVLQWQVSYLVWVSDYENVIHIYLFHILYADILIFWYLLAFEGLIGAYMGWQIRLGNGEEVTPLTLGETIREAHPKSE